MFLLKVCDLAIGLCEVVRTVVVVVVVIIIVVVISTNLPYGSNFTITIVVVVVVVIVVVIVYFKTMNTYFTDEMIFTMEDAMGPSCHGSGQEHATNPDESPCEENKAAVS